MADEKGPVTSHELNISEDLALKMRSAELLDHPFLNFLDQTDYFDRDAWDLVKYRFGQLLGLRGGSRPLARWQGTLGSRKWESGQHNAGCVLHSPESVCICREFSGGSLCIECRQRERFKTDLLCEVCRAKAYEIEPSTKPPCRCNCGYTCGRQCRLPFDDCMAQHWKRDCDHVWNGPWKELKGDGPCGGGGGSVTCSKCGMSSIDHDCAVGP